MATFQGRSGPSVKTVTRRVDNIIFDSPSKTLTIDYTNYYYSPKKNSTPHFFEDIGPTGLSFEVIRSGLFWNNLELDSSTRNHYYPNGYLSTNISEFMSFYNTYGYPLIEQYESVFDELYPKGFVSQINERSGETSRYILLSNNDRKTATMPFKHYHGDSDLSHLNDVFHFSMAEDSIASNSPDDTLLVVVYRSIDSYDTAIKDLKSFHSKKTSTKVSEFTFEYTSTTWQAFSINLRDLEMPVGDCLLWMEFIRLPVFPKSPFDTTPWNTTLIDDTWYNYSHTRVYPNTKPTYPFKIQDTTGWVSNPNTVALEANTDPESRPIGLVSGEDHENYIFESVVKSTSFDDDAIGLVIGFVFENGYEYTLTAYRSQGGNMESKTWFVVANAGQSIGFTGTNYNELGAPMPFGVYDNSSSVGFATNSWATEPVGTKIRVEKTTNEVKVYTSQMNSTTIDLSTEIVIPLTGDNARFKRSKIGFSSWGQPLTQFHNVYFQTVHTGLTENEVKNGNVGVGGFGIEQTNKVQYFANPKSNRYFIEHYHHEKFTDKQNSNIIVESFNSIDGTMSVFKDNPPVSFLKSSLISKKSLLFIPRGNDYTDAPTIGDWEYRPYLQLSNSKSFDVNPFVEDMPGSKIKSWGGELFLESGTSFSHQPVSFQGITYNFERPSEYVFNTLNLIRQESNFALHLESFNPLNLNYETELSRAEVVPATHNVVELSSGLYLLESDAYTAYRALSFGPPKDIAKPISKFGIGNPKDTFYKNNQFFDLLSNYDYKDGQYVEITKNTSLGDTTWKETIKVLNFDFSKTAYFEYSKPIELPIKVFYTPVLDKPFVHKVFFVNFDTGEPKFKPFVQSPDKTFLIEQNYMHSMVSIGKGPKNKFKHLMIEELFRPGYRSYDQVYEFMMEQFEVVSSVPFDYKKFGESFYEPILTNRPSLSGGSNAFGHDVLPVDKGPTSDKNKMFDLDRHIENSLQGAGRSGTHRDNEYREVQNIEIYEFQYLDWDIKTQSPYLEEWRINKEKSTFNFIYTIDDTPSNGRIPECLKLEDGRISGQIQDTDKFLRKYSYESWMKVQGKTDNDGNFTSFADSLDFSYEDYELITPREWEVNLTGRSITKGTIDLVYDGIELKRGNIIQQSISGAVSEFEIVEKISEFTKESDRGSGLVSETIHRYEFENLRGDIEITTITDLFTQTFVDGKTELQNAVSDLQEELEFSVDMRASRLQKQIDDLNSTILENDSVNPTGYAYVQQTPAGKQVNFQYVSNEDGDTFVVDNLELTTTGTVSKFVKLVFKIRNNWSFDRDLRLFTEDGIDDSEFENRTAWVADQRSNKRGLFDPQTNNNEMDQILIDYMKEYDNSIISIEEYIEQRNIVIEGRIYITPDQKNEYINYLDEIIYIDKRTGEWKRDIELIKIISVSDFSSRFPINDGKNRGEHLDTTSETENGEQVYKINCTVTVDEQTFYNNVDDVRIIRGYPVYASCN